MKFKIGQLVRVTATPEELMSCNSACVGDRNTTSAFQLKYGIDLKDLCFKVIDIHSFCGECEIQTTHNGQLITSNWLEAAHLKPYSNLLNKLKD